MPMAARVADTTSHGTPLSPGPGSPDVLIGFMPAWRAMPAGAGAGLESASSAMSQIMNAPMLRPPQTISPSLDVANGLSQSAAQAAAAGNPGGASGTASALSALTTANVSLTAAYTAAAAVPGSEPAAAQAYTLGIQAAAAASASAAFSAIAAGIADIHVCPIPAGIPPHGPGVVTQGSKSVLINNLPAARQGDKVIEAAGGSDPIAIGCTTVLIGDDGGGGGQCESPSCAEAFANASADGVPLVDGSSVGC